MTTRAAFESRYRAAGASPGFLLWKAANLHQRLQRHVLAEFDLTPTQFSLLACFFDLASSKGGPVSQAEVCEHAALDKMLVSDATRALSRKKLLVRARSMTDRRSFAIELTPRGKEVCNEALRVVEALDAEFFGRTDDVAGFVAMMARLLAAPP